MMKLKTAMTTVLGILLLAGQASAAEWVIDKDHSQVTFKVRHMMITNVRGTLGDVTGDIKFDPKNLKDAKFNLTVDVSSIDTDNQKRDDHLRSADFFDTAKHPNATFVSTKVRKRGKDKYKITGDLTIRGKTKPITFNAEITDEIKDPWGNIKRGAEAEFKINRKDFGVNWNKALDKGGVVVGDEVTVMVELEINKKKEGEKES